MAQVGQGKPPTGWGARASGAAEGSGLRVRAGEVGPAWLRAAAP